MRAMDSYALTSINQTLDVTQLSGAELVDLSVLLADEQRRRAVEAGDPDALTELGFQEGFTSSGLPRDPWVVDGLVICAGARIDRSGTSHDCGFVHVGEQWIWEASELVLDTIRNVAGPRPVMRSVSILAPAEGCELDLVVSRMKSGVHQMRAVRSFCFTNGALTLVSARARQAPQGR